VGTPATREMLLFLPAINVYMLVPDKTMRHLFALMIVMAFKVFRMPPIVNPSPACLPLLGDMPLENQKIIGKSAKNGLKSLKQIKFVTYNWVFSKNVGCKTIISQL
jgi:hypothetical protein